MMEEKWVVLSLSLHTHNGDGDGDGDGDGVTRLSDGNGPNRRGGLNSESYSLSPGYRFNPTDVKLLRFYLKNKVLDNPIPPNDRIREANVYTYNPDQLFEMYGLKREEEWYFFTRRDKKSSSNRPPKKIAGDGYWKATSGVTPIRNNNTIVGYKKSLAFFKGTDRSRGVKTPWLMQEYTLHCQINTNTATTTKVAGDVKLDNWVLCKIYCRHKRGGSIENSRNNQQQQDQDEGLPIEASYDDDQQQPHYSVQANIKASTSGGSN